MSGETYTQPPGLRITDRSGGSHDPLQGGGTYGVTRKSVSYAIQAGDAGAVFVATAGDVVFTLPAVADGLTFTFVDTVGDFDHPTIVRPQAADRLHNPGPNGNANHGVGVGIKTANAVAGQTVVLIGVAGVGWIEVGEYAGWAYES
jgi:hypothetical protein